MKAEKKCENCKWYDKWPKEKNGFCHRNPPQFIALGNSQAFPSVDENAFCGEYKLKVK